MGWLSESVRDTMSSLFSLSLCMNVRFHQPGTSSRSFHVGVEDGTQVEGPSKTRVKCGKPVHSPAPTSTPTDVSSCLLADVPGSVRTNPVQHDNPWLLTCGTHYSLSILSNLHLTLNLRKPCCRRGGSRSLKLMPR